MGTWLNSDGLYIRSGQGEVTPVKGGELPAAGEMREIYVYITLAGLTTTEAILHEGILIPKGCIVQEVKTVAEVAAVTGDAATLDVGLIRTDRTTAYDDDGLGAAIAAATMGTIGEVQVLTQDITGHGALVGTTLANDGYVTASVNTGTFSAGIIKFIVKIYVP